TELDAQQSKAARYQVEHIQKQLRRIGETIPLEKELHVDPSPTHDDSGTERARSEQAGDRAGAGDLTRGGSQSPTLELHRGAGTQASREGRTAPPTDPGTLRPVQGESRASP